MKIYTARKKRDMSNVRFVKSVDGPFRKERLYVFTKGPKKPPTPDFPGQKDW